MNHTTIFFASRTIVLVLASLFTLSFAACSSDDDNEEPAIEELLSEETTPIDFKFFNDDYNKMNILFDYAGKRYVGSDTITRNNGTVDLRQGKHHLIWMRGLDDNHVTELWEYNQTGDKYYSGIHFDPETMTITTYNSTNEVDVSYSEKDLEVTPYLMPVQEVNYELRPTADIKIYVTDMNDNLVMPILAEYHDDYRSSEDGYTGNLVLSPFVKSVSLVDNSYELSDKPAERSVWTCYLYHYYYNHYNDEDIDYDFDTPPMDEILVDPKPFENILCPLNGLDNLKLTADIQDANGNKVKTTAIPKFSIKRGYKTILRGPLFSGTTDDWTVELKPYE